MKADFRAMCFYKLCPWNKIIRKGQAITERKDGSLWHKQCFKRYIHNIFLGKEETRRNITRHHILTRRHFGRGRVVLLCRRCHDKLERLIPLSEQPQEFYWRTLSK